MEKLKWIILALFFGIFTLSGCFIDINDDGNGLFGCISGSGSTETQTLDIDEFTSIKLEINLDVYITQGDDFSVEVEGKENIIDDLKLSVSNNTWTIDTDHCTRNIGNMKVYITMPNIEYLKISGSGKIIGENTFTGNDIELRISGSGDMDLSLETDNIEAKISGSGEMWLEGNSSNFDFKISGSGDLNAFDLESDNVDVRISGSGDARVRAIDELNVTISGSGNVYYKGSPSINVHISGSGNLIDSN